MRFELLNKIIEDHEKNTMRDCQSVIKIMEGILSVII